jgi:arginine repressor
MSFSEGYERIKHILYFIGMDFRTKKEIMAYMREQNIVISYRTLERDLKHIKEVLNIPVVYKKGYGYRSELNSIIEVIDSDTTFNINSLVPDYEDHYLKVLNTFEYNGAQYFNCLNKQKGKVFTIKY